MDDNANLEKMTRTKLLMTEGESRRGRGGGGRRFDVKDTQLRFGTPSASPRAPLLSRRRHYINQPLISVSRQVIFCSSCSFSLADWKKICQNSYFGINEISSEQENSGYRTLLTSSRKMVACQRVAS